MIKNDRGFLSSQVLQQKAKQFFGEEFDIVYVRLLPYIDYVLKNGGMLRESYLSLAESEILAEWCEKGFLEVSHCKLSCTSKEFYDIMCEILWDKYVVH